MEGNNKEENQEKRDGQKDKQEKENAKQKDSKNEKEKKETRQSFKGKKENIKEKIFIYFIENHVENIPSDIELDKNKFATDLELLSEGSFPVNKINYKYRIYRFKIINFKSENKVNVKIKLKNKINNKVYESKIIIKDFDFDIVIYDFKFKPNKKFMGGEDAPPQYKTFNEQEIFDMYVKYLRSKNLLQDSEENINLILWTHKLILCQKYKFSFYLLVLMESYSSSIYQKHIIEFDSNKVIGPGIITNEKKGQISTILQELIDKKNKEEHFKEENDRIKFKINLYTIFLYFNYLYNKEKFVSLLNDKQMEYDIFSGLLTNNILFKDIKLTKEQIGNLIKSASNFNELLNAFSFNKDILIFLQQIQNNFNKVVEIYEKESSETKKKSKKNLIINIEEFIIPSQNDNLEEISRCYINILDLQIKSNNKIFIIFGKQLFDKYIEYFKQYKILYLFYLRNIYQSMKEKISDFKMKNFDDIIIKNAIELSKKKQLKSIEILDIYSQISSYDSKNAHSIDIFEGLDVSTFNDEFYEKWKKINWNEIFGNQYKKFLEKITNIINFLCEIKVFKII